MADDQLEWVFDSLVEFLRGPIWNIPVLTFIEQKSVVFEPGAENEEELTKIHEAYKNLVDFMLGSYMEDLRITPEEFEKSCSVATKKALNQFHQNLFQQVWAADDFEIFKRMMTQKNLELQLQALEFLTQKRGSVPNCMEPNCEMKDEERAMEEIIKRAIDEDIQEETSDPQTNKSTFADATLQEKMKLEAQKEKELLEQAIKQSVQEKEPPKDVAEDKSDSEENPDEKSPNEENVPNGMDEAEDTTEEVPDEIAVEPVVEKVEEDTLSSEQPTDEASEKESDEVVSELPKLSLHSSLPPIESARTVIKATLPPLKTLEERPWSEGDASIYEQTQTEVTPMDLEKRQNYLRQQRDRILAMKKQERSRRLSNTDEVISQARPKSARAAKKALREGSTDDVDPQILAFRKSLAAKLRSEVIDKND